MRALVLLAVLLVGCGNIQKYERLEQPIGTALAAGPGDLLLRVERTRDLENVLGKADVWGGKTHEGYTEVRYMGQETDGSLVLARTDVAFHTNETTMSRRGLSFGSANTAVGGNTATSVGVTAAPTTTAYQLPPNAVAIRVKASEPLIVGAYVLLLKPTPGGVEYRIERR
jgi:hypothetical protein